LIGFVTSSIHVFTPSFVAMCVPSGDQTTSVRAEPVVRVSCSSPLPSGRIVQVS